MFLVLGDGITHATFFQNVFMVNIAHIAQSFWLYRPGRSVTQSLFRLLYAVLIARRYPNNSIDLSTALNAI
jgi:hypothetical protein